MTFADHAIGDAIQCLGVFVDQVRELTPRKRHPCLSVSLFRAVAGGQVRVEEERRLPARRYTSNDEKAAILTRLARVAAVHCRTFGRYHPLSRGVWIGLFPAGEKFCPRANMSLSKIRRGK